MAEEREPEAEPDEPSMEIVHKDISLANIYRLELSKILLTLAAALFAFTISFPPALTAIRSAWLLGLGWAGLALSMIGGFANLYGWEKFYITYRDYRKEEERVEGQAVRDCITIWRRTAHFFQFVGFAAGIAALAAFVVINRDNVKLAQPAAAANVSANAAQGPR